MVFNWIVAGINCVLSLKLSFLVNKQCKINTLKITEINTKGYCSVINNNIFL